MDRLPDLTWLSHDEKDALIRALWAQVQALTARVAELEAKPGVPPKTPDTSQGSRMRKYGLSKSKAAKTVRLHRRSKDHAFCNHNKFI